jgi:hypothetical protein
MAQLPGQNWILGCPTDVGTYRVVFEADGVEEIRLVELEQDPQLLGLTRCLFLDGPPRWRDSTILRYQPVGADE